MTVRKMAEITFNPLNTNREARPWSGLLTLIQAVLSESPKNVATAIR